MLFALMLRKLDLNQLLLSFIFQFAYDTSLYEFKESSESNVATYIDQLGPHMQAYFCKNSLGTKVKVEKVSKINPITFFFINFVLDRLIHNNLVYNTFLFVGVRRKAIL